ncbi:MAG: hypothetical protein J6V01_05095 [Clostridia bacterium]|nr:hypothetical protein [Clostridia bacterium]
MKILTATSDRELSAALCAVLRYEGHLPIIVYDGAEAINELSGGGFDAIVADEGLPRVRFDQLINKDAALPLPVLILVRQGVSPDIARERPGRTELLRFPFELKDFTDALGRLFLEDRTDPAGSDGAAQ